MQESNDLLYAKAKALHCEAGADPGEVKWVNFHPLFLSPLLSFFFLSSNIEIIFDFSDIITKFTPPFQNPRCALVRGIEWSHPI